MQWLVPDVPQKIQDKIDHERYIDQCERWAKPPIEHEFQVALTAADAVAKFSNLPNEHRKSPVKTNGKSPVRMNGKSPTGQHNRRSRISPEDKR
jgi:hypothetical protein